MTSNFFAQTTSYLVVSKVIKEIICAKVKILIHIPTSPKIYGSITPRLIMDVNNFFEHQPSESIIFRYSSVDCHSLKLITFDSNIEFMTARLKAAFCNG